MNEIDDLVNRIWYSASDLDLCVSENNDPDAIRLIDSMVEYLERVRTKIGDR